MFTLLKMDLKEKCMYLNVFIVTFIYLIIFIDGNSELEASNRTSIVQRQCRANLAKSTNIGCSDYEDIFPYKDKKRLDKECSIQFTPESKEYFKYKVLKFSYRFVNLRIQICNISDPVKYTKCAIQPLEWVWTFGGIGGGEQYLDWPPEYETLSMGMLKKYTSEPLRVNATIKGKCDIVIGQNDTTERFALAFADLIHDLGMIKDEYNYSYWCYKTRIYINSYFLYQLCKEAICPLETIGYKCCKQIYDVNKHKLTVQCPGDSFRYGDVWWVCPFAIGVVLYFYIAIMLAWLLSYTNTHLNNSSGFDEETDRQGNNKLTLVESTPLLQSSTNSTKNKQWVNHNHITVLTIACSPFRKFYDLHPIATSRVFRCLLVFSSVGVVFIKVYLHYIYHKDYIISSVKQGAPKDFLSMIAGYEKSQLNFLGFLGGPYIALSAYLGFFLVFILVPRDLGEFLVSGIPGNTSKTFTPLLMELKLRERFGGKRLVCTNQANFTKIYNTMLNNIYSLLNLSFWGYILTLQIERIKYFYSKLGKTICSYLLMAIVVPLYIIACLLEITLTIAIFGFPTIFGILIVFKAYFRNLYVWLKEKGSVGMCLLILLFPLVILMLLVTIYMFSIIFVDGFIYLAKIVIFTYTGLFVNPSYTEGWAIFGITMIMYLYDSIHSVNETYERLFTQTKKVCKRKSKQLKIKKHIYRKEVEGACVPRDLYTYVILMYKPIRVEVFLTLVKIGVIVFFLYISLGILVNFDGFQELNIVTQTATTIFVSFVPKLLKRMFALNERRKILRMRRKIDEVVESYLVYKGICMDESIEGGHLDCDNRITYDSI